MHKIKNPTLRNFKGSIIFYIEPKLDFYNFTPNYLNATQTLAFGVEKFIFEEFFLLIFGKKIMVKTKFSHTTFPGWHFYRIHVKFYLVAVKSSLLRRLVKYLLISCLCFFWLTLYVAQVNLHANQANVDQ